MPVGLKAYPTPCPERPPRPVVIFDPEAGFRAQELVPWGDRLGAFPGGRYGSFPVAHAVPCCSTTVAGAAPD
ncbi:Hypothetical protein NGAL_HAMBI490_36500 [Neorhizobium galegae bv. officinalis]|nr:Hypothetical protein NGAL_HAMBI490_36500 [Neorhizobium galegae bv. officinalis]